MVALFPAEGVEQLAVGFVGSADPEEVVEEDAEAVAVEEEAVEELETPNWATVTLPLTHV
jgi:hypothetical protein